MTSLWSRLFRRSKPEQVSPEVQDERRTKQQLLIEQNRERQALGDEVRMRSQFNNMGG